MATLVFIPDPIAPNEEVMISPDFGRQAKKGSTISSVVITITDTKSIDTSATSRLIGSPTFSTSPFTGQPNQVVDQLIGTCVMGSVYRIEYLVTMSNGEKLSAIMMLTCASV